MIITNKHQLPQPLVDATRHAIHEEYDGFDSDYTSSSIESPPYERLVNKRNWDIITRDVLDMLWIVYGQAVHVILEWAAKGEKKSYTTEKRVYYHTNNLVISGKFDVYYPDKMLLQDYKNTKAWSVVKPKQEWIWQINYMALMMKLSGLKVKKAEIAGLLRDWNKFDAMRGKGYPKLPVTMVGITLRPKKTVHERMMAKIAEHERVKNFPLSAIEPCTAIETWDKPARWLVTKKGNKRASKSFSAAIGAEEYAEKYPGATIAHHPACRPRCQDYCFGASECPAYKQFKEGVR